MPRYPKLLHWRAVKNGVDDTQAKLLWDYSVFQTRLFGLGKDYETMNELFNAELKTISFLNRLVQTPCKLCW